MGFSGTASGRHPAVRFGRAVGQVHVGAMGDHDEVGGEAAASEHSQDLFNIVLSVSVNCASIIISRLSPWYDGFMEIVSSVAEAGKAVNDKDAVWSPVCGSSKVSVVVLPIVEQLNRGDPCFWLSIDLAP